MCFSVPMTFELIPFDCSRTVLLAEVSAKWINFDYLSLTSFDFCKPLISACRRIFAIIIRNIIATAFFTIKIFDAYSQKERWIFAAHIIYIFKCMFVAYSQNVCWIFAACLICCLESWPMDKNENMYCQCTTFKETGEKIYI